MTDDTVITEEFLSSPSGVAFVKAQAWHEAGKPYPMTDDEWREAQRRVFGGARPIVKKSAGSIATGGAASAAAHQAGLGIGWVIAIGVAVAVTTFIITWRLKK